MEIKENKQDNLKNFENLKNENKSTDIQPSNHEISAAERFSNLVERMIRLSDEYGIVVEEEDKELLDSIANRK